MQQPPEQARGSIYDLGYRGYDGTRLGRANAFLTIYADSARGAFGIGRGARSKILPISLAILAFIPAAVQLGIAAIAPAEVDFFAPYEYYGYIQVVLVLFVAAAAPELTGRDQRNRTLALYFSRPLTRDDYAVAKLAAMATALLLLTIGPQTVMFAGNALASEQSFDYLRDNADDILPIVLGGLAVSGVTGSLGVAAASQTHRRMFAAGAILALLYLSIIIGAILMEALDSDLRRAIPPLPPIGAVEGFTYWVFGEAAPEGAEVAEADLPGAVYAGAVLAWTAASVAVTIRRYRTIST